MDYVDFQPPPQFPFVVMEGRLAGGPPVNVLLDSGAVTPFKLMVAPRAAAAAGIQAPTEADASGQGVSGAKSGVTTAELKSFSLGPVVMKDVKVGIFPALEQISAKVGTRVDVLVGAEFLKGRLVEIDYGRKRVNFAAAEPIGKAMPATLAANRPLMLVKVQVNGQGPFIMGLDTGASHTLLSTAAAERLKLKSDEAGLAGGAGGDLAVTTSRGAVTFGPHRRDVTLLVSSAVDKIGQAAGSPLDGILGADVFGSGKLTLDYEAARVWTEAGKPGA
ncbi:aspartyl protease family protein [Phenylobacterium sp. LjRoot219]|uniref:aspartyl protease family protein n=1 Tax=Phenylobacterium sp. LjRoot219 TaxID=3342283 RepID=UPI003ECF99CD